VAFQFIFVKARISAARSAGLDFGLDRTNPERGWHVHAGVGLVEGDAPPGVKDVPLRRKSEHRAAQWRLLAGSEEAHGLVAGNPDEFQDT
jgi:hypothetical protein